MSKADSVVENLRIIADDVEVTRAGDGFALDFDLYSVLDHEGDETNRSSMILTGDAGLVEFEFRLPPVSADDYTKDDVRTVLGNAARDASVMVWLRDEGDVYYPHVVLPLNPMNTVEAHSSLDILSGVILEYENEFT